MRHAIVAMRADDVPSADAGLILAALLATSPAAVTADIVEVLGDVIDAADLTCTWQSTLDDVFVLLTLLIPTKVGAAVVRVAIEVLTTEVLHPRWARKALALLVQSVDLRPDTVDPSELARCAANLERPELMVLIRMVFVPIMLSDPGAVTIEQLEDAAALLGSHYELRYLYAALANQPEAPPEVRTFAANEFPQHFALAERVRTTLSRRPLRILCVQNIADGQGDEFIRVIPLLQALLDDYPSATAVIVTDRGYLYRHSRVTTLSFDETTRVGAAMNDGVDVLLEFVDREQPHLNHDPLLPQVINELRAHQRLAIDVSQGKRWNQFTYSHVLVDGMDWASALSVDRPLEPNVYDPAVRLIAELGLTVRVGEQPPEGEWLLAGEESPHLTAEWTRLADRRDGRRVALLNPFGGNARLKGFTPIAFPDLARLIQNLVDEGFDVLVAPSGQAWGTVGTCRAVLSLLDAGVQKRVQVLDGAASPSDFIQGLLSFITRVDLVVTVEGWMMHAAYLAGKAYRLLTLPESDPRTWQPWGRSANQRIWAHARSHQSGQIPLPEQPRKQAWIEMLRRIDDQRWGPMLVEIAKSDDQDLRRMSIDAMARSETSDAQRLTNWLDDPSHRVRGSAAAALLDHHRDALGKPPIPDVDWLNVVRLVGGGPPQWTHVIAMGAAALPALYSLLNVDNPVTRRETAASIEMIGKNAQLRRDATAAKRSSSELLATSSARERTE